MTVLETDIGPYHNYRPCIVRKSEWWKYKNLFSLGIEKLMPHSHFHMFWKIKSGNVALVFPYHRNISECTILLFTDLCILALYFAPLLFSQPMNNTKLLGWISCYWCQVFKWTFGLISKWKKCFVWLVNKSWIMKNCLLEIIAYTRWDTISLGCVHWFT